MNLDKVAILESRRIIKEIQKNADMSYDKLTDLLNTTDTSIMSKLNIPIGSLRKYASTKTLSHILLYEISCVAQKLGYAGNKTEHFINTSFLQYLTICKLSAKEFDDQAWLLDDTNKTSINHRNQAIIKIKKGIQTLYQNGYEQHEILSIVSTMIHSLPSREGEGSEVTVEEIDKCAFPCD
jgi:hypothetical protein